MRTHMQKARFILIIAVAVLLAGYIFAGFIIPHLQLGLGFEGVLALTGAVGVVSFVVGSVLALRAAIIAGLALRDSATDRTVSGYLTLVFSSCVGLVVAVILVVAVVHT